MNDHRHNYNKLYLKYTNPYFVADATTLPDEPVVVVVVAVVVVVVVVVFWLASCTSQYSFIGSLNI